MEGTDKKGKGGFIFVVVSSRKEWGGKILVKAGLVLTPLECRLMWVILDDSQYSNT